MYTRSDIAYTFKHKRVSLIDCSTGFSSNETKTWYYNDGETAAIQWTSETSHIIGVSGYIDASSAVIGTQISFTISDLCFYEGSFKNPPVTTSLDVKPGNQFALSDLSNAYEGINFIVTAVGVGWVRLAYLNHWNNASMYYELIVGKNFNKNPTVLDYIKIGLNAGTGADPSVVNMKIERTMETTYGISKYRIAKVIYNSAYYYWLEGYYNYNTNRENIYVQGIRAINSNGLQDRRSNTFRLTRRYYDEMSGEYTAASSEFTPVVLGS